eukprot:SAG22_NODE_2015_length_3137_cov_7.334101_2_plen_95_part_00
MNYQVRTGLRRYRLNLVSTAVALLLIAGADSDAAMNAPPAPCNALRRAGGPAFLLLAAADKIIERSGHSMPFRRAAGPALTLMVAGAGRESGPT